MIVGLFGLVAGSLCLRFHLDFFSGVGYGVGIASLAVSMFLLKL
jgi:hypothetical protein